jgi:hypothetical protein
MAFSRQNSGRIADQASSRAPALVRRRGPAAGRHRHFSLRGAACSGRLASYHQPLSPLIIIRAVLPLIIVPAVMPRIVRLGATPAHADAGRGEGSPGSIGSAKVVHQIPNAGTIYRKRLNWLAVDF